MPSVSEGSSGYGWLSHLSLVSSLMANARSGHENGEIQYAQIIHLPATMYEFARPGRAECVIPWSARSSKVAGSMLWDGYAAQVS